MKRTILSLLFVLSIAQSPSKAEEIIIQPGDTLSEIANNYGISVRKIMDLNKLYNADNLEIGQKIILPTNARRYNSEGKVKHTVLPGENIGKIAKMYRIQKKDILNINNIYDPDILYPGQILILPKEAMQINKAQANKKSFHIISKGETLYKVADYYNKKVEDLIAINRISNPNSIKPGDKIFLGKHNQKTSSNVGDSSNILKKNKSNNLALSFKRNSIDEWRKYGPLEINWTKWKVFEGSLVAPAINNNGKPLLLAVNCTSSKLTWRASKDNWKKWFLPKKDFEFNLIDDLCINSN